MWKILGEDEVIESLGSGRVLFGESFWEHVGEILARTAALFFADPDSDVEEIKGP